MIVPCYQYARYLPVCVASALNQPGVEVEVLILDDASTDATPDVGRALAASDSRISYRRHAVNLGHIATYNEGLAWATGRYTVLLSADDLLAPGALTRAVELLDQHPEVGFAYGRPVHFDGDGSPPMPRGRLRGWTIWDGHSWLERRCREGHGCITSPEVVVRTELQHQLGGYRKDLPHTADIEMWMRFAAVSDVGYVRGPDQAFHRQHDSSLSAVSYGAALVELRQRKAAYDALFDDYGDWLSNREAWQRLAGKALAKDALWRACRAYDRGLIGLVPVEDLVDFARSAYPAYRSLPEHRGVRVREWLGTDVAARLRPGTPRAAIRALQDRIWWASWRRRGV